jgi:hypothetical protein
MCVVHVVFCSILVNVPGCDHQRDYIHKGRDSFRKRRGRDVEGAPAASLSASLAKAKIRTAGH